MEQQQPLLSEEVLRSYQYVGRTGSAHLPPLAGAAEVTVEEIRSASSFSGSYYPPSIHAALVGNPESEPPHHQHHHHDQAIVPQAGYGGGYSQSTHQYAGSLILDEVEIRQLLIDHVGHRCCWGSRPARTWKISAIEDCNVYVGTLETFIEEREAVQEMEPYKNKKIDEKDNEPELGIWELDLTSEFPPLFVPLKETRARVPHSEAVIKCSCCVARGEFVCQTCNAGQEPGVYKQNQMSQCSVCYGRGLIAHKDGSDTICANCKGKGMIPCTTCGSRGLVKCHVCQGEGSLLTRNIGLVRWKTLSSRKVTAASGAASVPEEVFHRAKGIELCNTQAYQCSPAYFADSYMLNKFSSEVIADRPHVPPSARVICERHVISVVPVTRVTMVHRKQSFSFYIIGLTREVHIKQYPSKFCWGLCCCLEWLHV